ncbi:acyl carrier protein [Amycolatopsis sp. cmx-11-12]|uniref:acyl carrier protein n=1 Tax=Amycolatopsis sp. cmx-11-12 TaxID=2785795 RepID=UPI0039185C7E
MSKLTLTDLTEMMRECAGESEEVDLRGDVLDILFDDLGYDSIALLETAARIQRDHGVNLPDDAVTDAKTPRALLGLVNQAIEDRR